MSIHFQSEKIDFKLKNQAACRAWIKEVISKEKKLLGELQFVFMNDEALLERNRQFLDHDYYTDIITFDYSEGKTVSGDILISTDRVIDNATKFGVTFEQELARVMIHGVLHLCGYKDK